MQFYTVAAVLLVSLFATSMALPARMAYYQQPSFYYQSRSTPQRVMYLQYVQQPSSSKTSSRLTNGAAAFVAGETVATGTYLKDDAGVEEQIVDESILDNTGANGAQSIAEAYPASSEAEDSQDEEVPLATADNQVLEDEIDSVAEDLPSQYVPEDVPEPSVSLAAKPAVPGIPEPAAVELPEDAENDDDDAYVPRKVAAKAPPAALPVGTFFPIDFGGTTGGAIAIANSFSTGVSGSAKSQAIAYGRPEPSSPKAGSIRRH